VRLLWKSVLLLSISSLSCHGESTPSLSRIEPSTVEVSQLPRPVTIVGAHLLRSPSLSLDDHNPAHITGPRVLLGHLPLALVDHSKSDELTVMLPSVMSLGSHDISVNINGTILVLHSGLNIINEAASRGDASSPNSGEAGSPSDTSWPNSGSFSQDATPSAVEPTSNPTSALSSDASALDGATAAPASYPTDASNTTSDLADAATQSPYDSGAGADTGSFNFGDTMDTSADTNLVLDAAAREGGADATSVDAGTSATDDTTDADITLRCGPGQFGSPEIVSIQGYDGNGMWSPTFTRDGLTMYFTDGSTGEGRLMKATRADRGRTFTNAQVIPSFFPAGATGTPYMPPSGLSLYFYSIQASGMGSRDLYVASRTSTADDFANPTRLTQLNSPSLEHLPWVSADELWMIWVSQRDGLSTYWTSTRPSTSAAFSSVAKLTSLSQPGKDGRMFITHDGLRAYFASKDRAGGRGSEDIWYATRNSLAGTFGNVTNIGVVNSMAAETDVTLTHDGEELFFVRTGQQNSLHRALATCN
jgi:hypothetical protein